MKNCNYFNIKYAQERHNLIINDFGGLKGVKDIGLLESALEFIKYDNYYPDFEDKLTHLVFSVAQSHPFLDGNKRTSIALGSYFLQINGYSEYIIDHFMEYMEQLVLMITQQSISKDDLHLFIIFINNDLPFTEELDIKYLEGLQTIARFKKNFDT